MAKFKSVGILIGKKKGAEAIIFYTEKGWTAHVGVLGVPDRLGKGTEDLTDDEAQAKIEELANEWREAQRKKGLI